MGLLYTQDQVVAGVTSYTQTEALQRSKVSVIITATHLTLFTRGK